MKVLTFELTIVPNTQSVFVRGFVCIEAEFSNDLIIFFFVLGYPGMMGFLRAMLNICSGNFQVERTSYFSLLIGVREGREWKREDIWEKKEVFVTLSIFLSGFRFS